MRPLSVAGALVLLSCHRAPAHVPDAPSPVDASTTTDEEAPRDAETSLADHRLLGCTLTPGPTRCAIASDAGPEIECWGAITSPKPLTLCSYVRGQGDPTELGLSGCMLGSPTVLVIPAAPGTPNTEGTRITTRAALARYLGVDSPAAAQAYARLALGQGWSEEAEGFHASARASGPDRFRVELLYRPTCGCFHDVSRVTLEVNSNGELRELERTVVARSRDRICVD